MMMFIKIKLIRKFCCLGNTKSVNVSDFLVPKIKLILTFPTKKT